MAGTIVVDRIESDGSYASTINVASKVNFTGGMQIGGQDTTFAGMRNRIHNGEFNINQRANTDHTFTFAGSGSAFTTVDRWGHYYYNLSGTFTPNISIKNTSDHPIKGSNGKCLEIVCNTADTPANNVDFFAMTQGVESQYISDIFSGSNAQPITLSFWVKSNKTGTYCVEIRDTQSGSGGTYILKEYTVEQSGIWEKKVLNIPAPTFSSMPSDNSQGLYIQFLYASGLTPTYAPGIASSINAWASAYSTNGAATNNQTNLFANSGNYIRMTDVQLEVGNTPTAFERRPYGMELAICQRYYCLLSPYMVFSYSTSSVSGKVQFPVTMRATPTGAFFSGSGQIDPISGANISPSSIGINLYPNNNQNANIISNNYSGLTTNKPFWMRDSELITSFSAEL
jgi:hypothetical protein